MFVCTYAMLIYVHTQSVHNQFLFLYVSVYKTLNEHLIFQNAFYNFYLYILQIDLLIKQTYVQDFYVGNICVNKKIYKNNTYLRVVKMYLKYKVKKIYRLILPPMKITKKIINKFYILNLQIFVLVHRLIINYKEA